MEECGSCPVLASYTLAFALQPRKKHGKTSVRVETSVKVFKDNNILIICKNYLCEHFNVINFLGFIPSAFIRIDSLKMIQIHRNMSEYRVMKTNLMRYLSSAYFVSQPLHASGISVAHHQEVYCIYTTRTNYCIYIYIYTVYLLMMDYRYARNI